MLNQMVSSSVFCCLHIFFFFFFHCFRIQKDRVNEREKELEGLQEKLAEQVRHCMPNKAKKEV